ncbi:GNAT family N-acetyltransferase [Bacteriovorax sp. Seq25_V]|uniref:GNAT family N-acetyltransferase n=1 Tax=Bacteriovorax sp. Seq25_V TaxID=1201288 RepID=UPI00038A0FE1|nr:GNAT family N-acetyltransferase [Bacteriovorax sp. Seq25_V]EQC43881.1 acetyltransferase (GNAT) domain protein [Bacteriovorax sp. Seq25_V]
MISRKAKEIEYQSIFLMGQDVWSDNMSETEYLETCFKSEKYKKGQWWILEDNGHIVSSLIVYKFKDQSFGIGSIATCPYERKKGYGSKLLTDVIGVYKISGHPIFLYSDIDAPFYERFGFMTLPEKYQKYRKSVCMCFGEYDDSFEPPAYF